VEPAKGIYAAMNKGVSLASSDLVWILNGGDRLFDHKGFLAAVEKMQRETELDMLVAGAALFRENSYQYTIFPRRHLLAQLVGINKQCQQAVLYRTPALREIGPFPERFKIAADYYHHWEFYLRRKRFATMHSTIVAYDMGGSSGNFRAALKEHRRVQRELAKKLPLAVNWANTLLWHYYNAKISAMKALGQTRLSLPLRRAWIYWNRLGEKSK